MSDLMKQAEPVAWYRYERFGEWRQIPASEWNFDWASMMVKQGWTEIPLYAALPTEATPVVLRAKEIAASALQTACETDPADPEHPDTVMLTTGDFETIVRLAIENSCEGNPTEAAIRADEREKCLKIAQAHRCTGMDGDFYKGINSACDAISKTIRRRGEG